MQRWLQQLLDIMEKDVKKKISSIVLALMMCVSVLLCGCSLVETDMSIYLNKSVATLDYGDKKVEITVKEYLTAFNNYGAQLMQENSYTVEQAQDATLTALINRRVFIEEAKSLVTLTNADKNNLWNQTYDSLVENIHTYEEELRVKWDMTLSENKAEEQEESAVVFNEYERKAYVVMENGEYVIKVVNNNTIKQDAEANNIADMQELIFNKFITNATRLTKEATRTYIKKLKLNEEGQKLSTDDASVFKREVERIYTIHEENLYTEKLENYHKYGNANGVEGDYTSSITVSKVLNKYRAMILKSNTLYKANATTYNSNMLDSFKDVDYVVDDNYFFVSHILLKFTTEQEAEYKALETKYKNGEITPAQYQTSLNNLYQNVGAIVRDADGKTVAGERINVNTFLRDLTDQLNAITGENAEQRKADLFNQYVYKHNEDPGIMNADYAYVIGNNDSKMVESFTEASRELHEVGQVGAISGLVRSTYGIHIIFYAGGVKNPITIPSEGKLLLADSDILKLTNTRLSMFNTKTVFDKVYETLVSDNYSKFESMELNTIKQDIKITKYTNNYKR